MNQIHFKMDEIFNNFIETTLFFCYSQKIEFTKAKTQQVKFDF